MNRYCAKCGGAFSIPAEDLAFFERVSPRFNGVSCALPPPALCPDCRQQRRMAWRNERSLYSRSCDRTGETLISAYPPQTPFPVIKSTEWWKETNDALRFGREPDFAAPIFPQIAALQQVVPRSHTFNYADDRFQNSKYTNCAGDLKNCYLIFGSGRDESCFYSTYINDCFQVADTYFAERCRNCYECVDIASCDTVFYGQSSSECRDCRYIFDCRGCSNCIACAGLRRKEFHVLNRPVSKAEFARTLKELADGNTQALLGQFEKLLLAAPRRFCTGERNQNTTGDFVSSSKNCRQCFDTYRAEDCAYCTWFSDGKDTMDFTAWGECELCYEVCAGGQRHYHCLFTAQSFGCSDCLYVDLCHYCKNCFACVGLKHEEYCILNKRYAKAEYETMVLRLIETMRRSGEWGEFFPPMLSPHGYNETIAQENYPLARDDALRQGFRWLDYTAPQPASAQIISAAELPAGPVSIEHRSYATAAIKCVVSGRLFRLIPEELDFYEMNGLPLPRKHPDLRHEERFARRNPRRLWQRECSRCGGSIATSYAPERKEKVLCENCYLQEIY